MAVATDSEIGDYRSHSDSRWRGVGNLRRVQGDEHGVVENLGEEIVERVLDRVGLPGQDLLVPYTTYKVIREWNEHGANAQEMRELSLRQYQLMDRLKMPDARFDLPYNLYMGPGGRVYDQRTGAPTKRIQDP